MEATGTKKITVSAGGGPLDFARRAARGARARAWKRSELRVYGLDLARIDGLPNPGLMTRDRFADLECYEQADRRQFTRDELLAAARERMGQGHHLYTRVEDGVLVHYGWLIDRQERGEDAALGLVFFPPPHSAALYDYFTHPRARGRGLYRDALFQILHDARDLAGAERAYIYVYDDNPASWRVVERVGFQHEGSLVKERRLFSVKRYATGRIDAAPLAAPAAATGAYESRRLYESHRLTSLEEVEDSLRRDGALAGWDALAREDDAGNFFQSPAWCVEWYRCYAEEFRPHVVAVERGGALVGVVPLAVERATGRVVFAGDNMSDYRDVIAGPGHRAGVVSELLRELVAGRFPNRLRVGPLQPESETLALLPALAPGAGLRAVVRRHECWRLWFADCDVERLVGKESVRRRVNHFKRRGARALERIETAEEWAGVREEFFELHTLRQLRAGREVSFNGARKRAFYDALAERHAGSVHVRALRADGRLVAGHFGYLWRGALYWGAPAHDVGEEKNSPGLALLALLIRETAEAGLRGIDYTLGVEDFKRRFGTERAELPTVEIYTSASAYRAARLRDRAVIGARRMAGDEVWPRVARLAGAARDARSRGAVETFSRLARAARRAMGAAAEELIFIATPATFDGARRQPSPTGAGVVIAKNELRHLARWDEVDAETLAAIASTLNAASERLREGGALYTALDGGRLAAWVWAADTHEGGATQGGAATKTKRGDDNAAAAIAASRAGDATVAGARVAADDAVAAARAGDATDAGAGGSRSEVFALYVLPQFRGAGVGRALLAHVLQEKFAAGVPAVQLRCAGGDAAVREAIESAGGRYARVERLAKPARPGGQRPSQKEGNSVNDARARG